VTEFLETFPRISARMLLVDRVVDLQEEGLDLGIRIGSLADSSIRATKLGSIRSVSCASPDYLARRGVPNSPRDLAGHDCISFTLFSPQRWSFGGRKAPRVTVRPRLTVNTAEAAIDAARAGLGIARVLSYQASESIARGALRLILVPFEPKPIPVNLIHREDRLPQAKVASFVAFAAPRLRARLRPESDAGA
jgi:DNA-binding transcriptional LysR family regulator